MRDMDRIAAQSVGRAGCSCERLQTAEAREAFAGVCRAVATPDFLEECRR